MYVNTEKFLTSHIELAKHISRGVLERDIEFHYSDLSRRIDRVLLRWIAIYTRCGCLTKDGVLQCTRHGRWISGVEKSRWEDLLGIANKITIQNG